MDDLSIVAMRREFEQGSDDPARLSALALVAIAESLHYIATQLAEDIAGEVVKP